MIEQLKRQLDQTISLWRVLERPSVKQAQADSAKEPPQPSPSDSLPRGINTLFWMVQLPAHLQNYLLELQRYYSLRDKIDQLEMERAIRGLRQLTGQEILERAMPRTKGPSTDKILKGPSLRRPFRFLKRGQEEPKSTFFTEYRRLPLVTQIALPLDILLVTYLLPRLRARVRYLEAQKRALEQYLTSQGVELPSADKYLRESIEIWKRTQPSVQPVSETPKTVSAPAQVGPATAPAAGYVPPVPNPGFLHQHAIEAALEHRKAPVFNLSAGLRHLGQYLRETFRRPSRMPATTTRPTTLSGRALAAIRRSAKPKVR